MSNSELFNQRLDLWIDRLKKGLIIHYDLVRRTEQELQNRRVNSPLHIGDIVREGINAEELEASDRHMTRIWRELLLLVNTPYSHEAIMWIRSAKQHKAEVLVRDLMDTLATLKFPDEDTKE